MTAPATYATDGIPIGTGAARLTRTAERRIPAGRLPWNQS